MISAIKLRFSIRVQCASKYHSTQMQQKRYTKASCVEALTVVEKHPMHKERHLKIEAGQEHCKISSKDEDKYESGRCLRDGED